MSRYGSRTRVGQAVSDFGQPVGGDAGIIPAIVDYLVVAGGGGGRTITANGGHGGGGGGGVRSTVTATGGGGRFTKRLYSSGLSNLYNYRRCWRCCTIKWFR
jgi:hypothetical protein